MRGGSGSGGGGTEDAAAGAGAGAGPPTHQVFQTAVTHALVRSHGVVGRGLHSFPFPLNLSLLCPFSLNVSLLSPPYDPNKPWMCPEGAQVELQRERCVPKVLKLSFEVSECKPLVVGGAIPLVRPGQILLSTTAHQLKKRGLKMRVDDVVGKCLTGFPRHVIGFH